jgi:hypothetical protein
MTTTGCAVVTAEPPVDQCPGQDICGTACVTLASDAMNCGTCGLVCDVAAPFCSAGTCSATCGGGLTTCGSSCSNLQTSQTDCGACGVVCGNGALCQAGACVQTQTGVGGAGNVGVGGSNIVGAGGSDVVGAGGSNIVGAGGSDVVGAGGSDVVGAGGSTVGGDPPGYWRYDTWGGCVWTGVDEAPTVTTITPQDFTGEPAGGPYHVSGTVEADPDYQSVALLGFNLAEDAAAADCVYAPVVAGEVGPPGVTFSGTGLAISFSKSVANTLRVQIQGPNGADDERDRWCYTITDAAGPIFAPYNKFTNFCWGDDPETAEAEGENDAGDPNAAYAGEPVSAVVFLTPGKTSETPFDFEIVGFADGNSIDDAPTGGSSGPLSGTIGGAGSTDLDYERVKIKKDGKSYIIQNNNWGNPGNTDQTIQYTDNSFVINSPTGGEPGGGAPASFPSIFIGANGDVQGGTYSTSSDDNLPMQVNLISSVNTSFSWGGSGGGDFNATYDVWFANQIPAPGSYDDGIDGFVMVWFYKPGNRQPIGSVVRQATIAGRSWDVWYGPRGGTGSNAAAHVVSYVATSTLNTLTFDLKDFITDASANGISGSMYLTDVFAGFEIWNGSGTQGLSAENFTVDVQ